MHNSMRARLRDGLQTEVPDYVENYVDRVNEIYRRAGFGDIPWQYVPLAALMAELEHKLEANGAVPQKMPDLATIDLRTREGRALKAAGVV